jgi:hypothetical protein
MEARTHSRWVSQLLEELGHEVILAKPSELYGRKRRKRRNDKLAAEMLARLAAARPQRGWRRGAGASGGRRHAGRGARHPAPWRACVGVRNPCASRRISRESDASTVAVPGTGADARRIRAHGIRAP